MWSQELRAQFAVAELQRAAESTELSLAQTIRSCCCSGQLFLCHTGQEETEGKCPKVRLEKETLQLSSPLLLSSKNSLGGKKLPGISLSDSGFKLHQDTSVVACADCQGGNCPLVRPRPTAWAWGRRPEVALEVALEAALLCLSWLSTVCDFQECCCTV